MPFFFLCSYQSLLQTHARVRLSRNYKAHAASRRKRTPKPCDQHKQPRTKTASTTWSASGATWKNVRARGEGGRMGKPAKKNTRGKEQISHLDSEAAATCAHVPPAARTFRVSPPPLPKTPPSRIINAGCSGWSHSVAKSTTMPR